LITKWKTFHCKQIPLWFEKKITEKKCRLSQGTGTTLSSAIGRAGSQPGIKELGLELETSCLFCLFVFFSLRPENPFNQSISSDLMDYESSLIQVHLSSALIGRAGDQSEIKALDRNGWRSFLQGSALISHHISSSFFFLFDIAGISAIFFCWLWLKMADA